MQILCLNSGDWTDQVIAYVELPSGNEFYTPDKSKKAIIGKLNTDLILKMLAFRLNFNKIIMICMRSVTFFHENNCTDDILKAV